MSQETDEKSSAKETNGSRYQNTNNVTRAFVVIPGQISAMVSQLR